MPPPDAALFAAITPPVMLNLAFVPCHAQATTPAAAVTVGDIAARNIDSALRENNVTVVAQGTRRCDHASAEVKRTAFPNRNDLIYIALFARNDSAEIGNSVLVGLFASTKTVRRTRTFSYVVCE